MSGSEFLVGRKPTPLREPHVGEDRLFAAQHEDGMKLTSAQYSHCTFANIGFKDAVIEGSTFSHCVFAGCYFRQSVIRSSSFIDCRFIDCSFPKVSIQSCQFKYASFSGCYIPFAELEQSLPNEPNLRFALSHNLAREAESLGATREAHAFRLDAIHAQEEDLLSAIVGRSSYYKEHFKGTDRVGAGVRFLRSKANGILWGHGERFGALLLFTVLAYILLFPIILLVLKEGLNPPSLRGDLSEIIYLSIESGVPQSDFTRLYAESIPANITVGAASIFGIVVAGLAVSMLLRWVARR